MVMALVGNTYTGLPDNPRTAAVVCYLTPIGWLYAYFAIYRKNRTPLAAFHLRQTLLLHVVLILIYVMLSSLYADFLKTLNIILFAIWFWGLIDAVNARKIPVPIIGFLAQKLFKGL